MTDSYANQVTLNVMANKVAEARCVVPGKVGTVNRVEGRERDVELLAGIGRMQAGEQVADGPTPSAPVMYPGGGGFAMTWPLDEGDECLGLVADRNNQRWRQNRTPGEAHSQQRAHDLSDAMILPVSITAAANSPDDPGKDWVLSGPEGEALRIGGEDGAVTLSKGGVVAATFSMAGDGEIVIEVAAGKSVKIGGAAAVDLAKAQQLLAALDAAITAAVAAALPIVPPAGDGGTAGFTAFQLAWDAAKNAIATTKAKGE